MTHRKKTNYAQFDKFQEAIAQGRPNDWRCRAGSRYLYICEDGLVHYCIAAARVSGRAPCRVHNGGCEAGVFDGEELRAQLHHWMRAPDQLYRPLEGAAEGYGFAGVGEYSDWGLKSAKGVPRGLKPMFVGDSFGTAEVLPFQRRAFLEKETAQPQGMRRFCVLELTGG